jgi:hypothetical protein
VGVLVDEGVAALGRAHYRLARLRAREVLADGATWTVARKISLEIARRTCQYYWCRGEGFSPSAFRQRVFIR